MTCSMPGRLKPAPADVSGESSPFEKSARRSLTARDSSSLRAGASPSQKGIVGGAPMASATRTVPDTTRVICHEAFPS
jgi:hypothetical protein